MSYNFINAPANYTTQIDGHTVSYQRHHVIGTWAGNSTFLSALIDRGLFSQVDFSINGLGLPDSIDGIRIDAYPDRTSITGAAVHRGGHTAYNRMQTEIFRAFDNAYETAVLDNWDGLGSETAWLETNAKKVYGFIGFLKTELTNPTSIIKLHGNADLQRSDLGSGVLWSRFASTFFNADTLEFTSEITQHPGYVKLSQATGLNDPVWKTFSASIGSGSPFDISTHASPTDVSQALQDKIGISPDTPTIFESARVNDYKIATGIEKIILALTLTGLYQLAAQHAEAHDITVADAVIKLGIGLDESQIRTIAAEVGIDITASFLLGPMGAAKKTWDILSSTDDAISAVKLYDHLYGDNQAMAAVSDLAYALEASPAYKTYKDLRDAGVEEVAAWPEFFLDWLETEGQKYVVALAAAGVEDPTGKIRQSLDTQLDRASGPVPSADSLSAINQETSFSELLVDDIHDTLFMLSNLSVLGDYSDYGSFAGFHWTDYGNNAWWDYYANTGGSNAAEIRLPAISVYAGTVGNGDLGAPVNGEWGDANVLNPIIVDGSTDPVVLDLDGDGIELIGWHSSPVYFDMDGDKYKEQTGWVGADDGLLVIDLKSDNVIDDRKEFQFSSWHADATSDYDGLRRVFDTNGNGALDAGDARFAEFKVWQDSNQNGIADAGELKTLAQLDITSISLTSNQNSYNIAGNVVVGESTYTKSDGSVGRAADVKLTHRDDGYRILNHLEYGANYGGSQNPQNYYYVIQEKHVRPLIDYFVAALEMYQSLGIVPTYESHGLTFHDLLFDLMEVYFPLYDTYIYQDGKRAGGVDPGTVRVIYKSAEGSTGDTVDFSSNPWIYEATGGAGNDHFIANDNPTTFNGGNGNDRLQGGLFGDTLIGGSGNDELLGNGGDDTLYFDADDTIVFGGSGHDVAVATGSQGVELDLGVNEIEVAYGTEFDDHFSNSSNNAATMHGGAGNDLLLGGSSFDVLYGGDGNDVLEGRGGHDILVGGQGDDILVGGAGNDELTGGLGADKFVFGLGDGKDVITDFDVSSDLIELEGFGANMNTFDKLFAHVIDTAFGARIELSDEDSILLQGISSTDLKSESFIFHA